MNCCSNCTNTKDLIKLEFLGLDGEENGYAAMCLTCMKEEYFWCERHNCKKALMLDPDIQEDQGFTELLHACPKCTLEKLRSLSPSILQESYKLVTEYGNPIFLQGLAIGCSMLTEEELTETEHRLFVTMFYCEIFGFEFTECVSTLIRQLSGSALQ